MKLVLILLVLAGVGIWVYSAKQTPVVLTPQADNQASHSLATAEKMQMSKNPKTTSTATPSSNQTHLEHENINEGASHLDQLSPEMKQAVKDKLLHSEPLDIKKDDKGRTVLKHNGRFTQMPVAVKQADGSVMIKEYSHIPESK